MRKPPATVILSVILALSWIVLLASGPRAAEDAPPRVQQWEYKVTLLKNENGEEEEEVAAVERRLNELGQQGWELSELQLSAAIFKRPKQ